MHNNTTSQKTPLLAIFYLLLSTTLTACDAKDACLDSGGSYNEETKQCER